MVEVQIFAFEDASAILAGVLISLENIMPGELDLFFRQSIEEYEQNHFRDAQPERNGVDTFGMRLLLREVSPLVEIKGLKGTVIHSQDDLGMAFKEQGKGAAHAADVDRLPQAVEHEHLLIEERAHDLQDLARKLA